MAALRSRRWPGNVRELENAIERAAVLAPGEVLGAECFVEDAGPALPRAPGDGGLRPLRDVVADAERAAIVGALEAAGGNRAAAARGLQLSERTLYYKLRALGID